MTDIIGLVLAGGRGRRLGGAGKAGQMLGDQTLLEWTAARLGPQCRFLLVSLAPDMHEPSINATIVRDATGTFEGPLAGLLAGINWIAEHAPDMTHVLTAPVDSPFLPPDLCERLIATMRDPDDIAVARSNGQAHVLHAIWPLHLREDLRAFIETEKSRKVRDFQDRHTSRFADWEAERADAFFNINTNEELAQARAMLALHSESEMKIGTTLNLCGLKCPLPVLKTKKALAAMQPGELLEVTCTDPLAAIDIPIFVQQSGDILHSQETRPDGVLAFAIIKK
jgi:molybdenum cofactor guanylyltransferase